MPPSRRRESRGTTGRADRLRAIGRVAGLAAIVALVCFGLGYMYAAVFMFPEPEETAGTSTEVPDVTGWTVEQARERLTGRGLVLGEVMEIPHPEEAPGVITAQAPLPGQRTRPGSTIDVGVSAGPARATVPGVLGLSGEAADRLLTRLGFQVETRQVEAEGEADRVVRTVPAPGQAVTLPSRILVYVSVPPPPPPEPAGGDSAAALP